MNPEQNQNPIITPPTPTPPSPAPVHTSHKGVLTLSIIVVILLLVAGYLFLENTKLKNGDGPILSTQSAKNTYSEPGGLYSFEYPSTWTVTAGDGLVGVPGAVNIKTEGLAIAIVPTLDDELLKEITKSPDYKKDVGFDVSGSPVDVYKASGPIGGDKVMYVTVQDMKIDIQSSVKLNLIVMIQSYDPKMGVDFIKTIKINKEKVASFSDTVGDALKEARAKGKDAAIKATLANVRALAEIYYDKAQTYLGFCKNDRDLQSHIVAISPHETSCKDSKAAFAMSSALETSGFFCVDSTGLAKVTTSQATGTSCPK